MAKPVVFNWPNASVSAVAFESTMNDPLYLTIPSPVSFGNVSRRVTLQSISNAAAVQFTITGTYQGSIYSETIAGPNNTTVSTFGLFDSVISVSYNTPFQPFYISVGSGTVGATNWFLSNYNQRDPLTAIQINVTGTISYTYQSTLSDVSNLTSYNAYPATSIMLTNGVRVPNYVDDNTAAYTDLSGVIDTDGMSYQLYPTLYSRILITSSTVAAGSLVATFLQQGIT